jgi:hypothetical protein
MGFFSSKPQPIRQEQVNRIKKSKEGVCRAYATGTRQQIQQALAVSRRAWGNSTPAERQASGKR